MGHGNEETPVGDYFFNRDFMRLAGEATFRRFALPLSPRGTGKTCSSTPVRGEVPPLSGALLHLPQDGTVLVPVGRMSKRRAAPL